MIVNVCEVTAPLLALIWKTYAPDCSGMPLRLAVPSPLSVKTTPGGRCGALRVPGSMAVIVCAVPPRVDQERLSRAQHAGHADFKRGGIGGADRRRRHHVQRETLRAIRRQAVRGVIVIGYEPEVPNAGTPESVAVPLPLSTKNTPAGSTPVSLSTAVGLAVVVTLKVLVWPMPNVVLEALLMVGDCLNVNVNCCTVCDDGPLLAFMLNVYVPPTVDVPLSVACHRRYP